MSTAKKWFAAAVIAAFSSALSIVQINSYRADKYELNGLYLAGGIIFGLATVYFLWKVSKNSNKGGGN